jgi:hypothetical protein
MTVSKRLRFEILRRDQHTCQYCGEKAPDVTLHVDHVIPVALGGTDKPDNLVAACKDCNIGKSSVPADAPLVAQVAENAAAYALILTDKMTQLRATYEATDEYVEEFLSAWEKWTYTSNGKQHHVALPDNWRASVRKFAQIGIPEQMLSEAIEKAMTKKGLRGDTPEFSYMAGVIWRTLDELDVPANLATATVRIYTELEMDEIATDKSIDGYMAGCRHGYEQARKEMEDATRQSEHPDRDLGVTGLAQAGAD